MINSLTSSTAASVLSVIEDDTAPTDLAARTLTSKVILFLRQHSILDERNDLHVDLHVHVCY